MRFIMTHPFKRHLLRVSYYAWGAIPVRTTWRTESSAAANLQSHQSECINGGVMCVLCALCVCFAVTVCVMYVHGCHLLAPPPSSSSLSQYLLGCDVRCIVGNHSSSRGRVRGRSCDGAFDPMNGTAEVCVCEL